jgi:hypothetical protein
MSQTERHILAHDKKGLQFLEAYAKCGCVSEACELSGTSRSTHYWRLEHFAGYRKKFAQAHRDAVANAVERVRRRLAGSRLGQNSTLSDT